MTRFYPVYVSRSDGRTEVESPNKGKLRNGPTQQQLDRTPNEKGVCDYYREISADETKHLDWRRKLAGMLLKEIGGAQHSDRATTSILYELPENYRLFEHIKSRADSDPNKSHKASKNHSGGGHDRQDAYLYGHPLGPKKRFRSPADFFPHLLWLITDESGDSENCSCKLCCPEELESDKAAREAKANTPTPAFKKEEGTPAGTPVIGRNPAIETIRRPSSTPQSPISNPSTPSNPTMPMGQRGPPALTPTPLPQPRSVDQQVDSQYDKFIYRCGEVVWFYRDSTRAWALGVVVRRWLHRDTSANTRGYLVQGLSHPFDHPSGQVVTQEALLRPFLAWSVPNFTFQYLQDNPQPYDQVDWQGLLLHKFGSEGEIVVDASILAAKSIDITYTPFELLKTLHSQSGQEERYYNGLYFGPEKIWCGEVVRLRIGSGTDVMIVSGIVERALAHPIQPNPQYTAYFIGDIYTFCTVTVPNPASPPQLPPNHALPFRMREDLRWRNDITLRTTNTIGYWKLVATNSRLEISEIKGRWYETSILFPILQEPDTYETSVRTGDVGDTGVWMNSRGDGSGLGKAIGTRKQARMEALGQAVPSTTRLAEGIDPPPPQQLPQQPPPQAMQMPPLHLDPAAAGQDHAMADSAILDDYLDLEGIDAGMEADPLADFGTGYGGHDGSHPYFG